MSRYIADGEASYTCPIYFELLAGARESEVEAIEEGLGFCHRFPFDRPLWGRAADLYRTLRIRGVTVPREDVFVAAAALELRLPLLCHDRHFDLIRDGAERTLRVERLREE